MTIPNIFEFYSSKGYSPAVFDDGDESFYLKVALNQATLGGPESLYYEHAQLSASIHPSSIIFSSRPDQVIGHLVYGYTSKLFNLHVLEVVLIGDILCCLFSYFFLAKSFYLLMPNKKFSFIPEVFAVVTIVYPWTMSIENYIRTDWLNLSSVKPISHLLHSCPPIMEAVESQTSAAFCSYLLFTIVNSRTHFSRCSKSIFYSGLLAGLLMYFYVASWIPLLFVGSLFNLFFTYAQSNRITICLVDGATFFAGSVLVAFPGILRILTDIGTSSTVPHLETYRSLWYFSPVWLLIAIIGVFTISKSRRFPVSSKVTSISLLIAAIGAEFIVLNLQPLLGISTQGVFFLLCGTRPIITYCSLVLLSSFLRPVFTPRGRIFSLLSLFVLVATSSGIIFYGKQFYTRDINDTIELLQFIDRNTPKDSVIAVATFERIFSEGARESDLRNFPNVVSALTNRFILKDAYGLELHPHFAEEKIRRELALGAFLTGDPRLSRPCVSALADFDPMSFYQQWVAMTLARRDACEKYSNVIKSFDHCQAFTSFKVDYVIWENKILGKEKPAYLVSEATLSWKSSLGNYEVYAIDQTTLKRVYCKNS